MVETITPAVHGGRARWLGGLALHALGATVTALGFGAFLGALGAALGGPFGRAGWTAIATLAGAYALAEVSGLRIPVPQLRRQVPDWWRTFFGRPVAATLYGAGLGIGFLTYLAHGTLVVVAAAAFASGRPAVGALLLAPFGLVRGVSAVTAWDATSSERAGALVDRLASIPDRWRRVANAVALTAVGVLAIAAAASGTGGWWELGAAALAGVFAWAAAAKVLAPRRWARALTAHALPPALTRPLRWGVPTAEALVAVLVAVGRPRTAAAWAMLLVTSFTVELLRVRRRVGGLVPCGCFGRRVSVRASTALWRNAGLAAIATLVVARGTDEMTYGWLHAPARSELLPVALTVGAIGATVILAWRAMTWLAPDRRP